MSSFCNVPQSALAAAAGAQCQWPRGSVVRWAAVKWPPGWSEAEFVNTLKASWNAWEAVCGFRTELVSNAKTANIVVQTRRIDGPAGVLAEAELPCGNVTSITQLGVWFDDSEQRWVDAINMSGGMIDLRRVAIHEFGHSAGMGHAPDGQRDIMAPTISDLRAPGPWSTPQMVSRYGETAGEPPDKPPDDTPDCTNCLRALTQILDSEDGKRFLRSATGLIESFTK